MKIGVNKDNKIKQIGTAIDSNLTSIEFEDDNNPFLNWEESRILSYCYKEDENGVVSYPYIDTDIIERLVFEENNRNGITSLLAYELIQKQMEVELLQQTQADLVYQLMIGGVL